MHLLARTLAPATLAAALAAALMAGPAAATTVTYAFSGDCSDCAAAAGAAQFSVHATLVLIDPQPGQPAGAAQFHSFSYAGSNLVPAFRVTRAGGGGDLLFDPADEDHSFHADFGGPLPGAAEVDLALTLGADFAFFNSAADGGWTLFRTDALVGDDFGSQGTWRRVPLPGPLALALLPLALLTQAGRARAARRRG